MQGGGVIQEGRTTTGHDQPSGGVERRSDRTKNRRGRNGGSGAPPRRARRARLILRKIDPWSVLKLSLVFYFCLLLIVLFASAVIFAMLQAFGVIANIEELLRSLELDVTISGASVFKWFFLVGLMGTVVMSAITVFMAFLYNLIADIVGGVELSLSEPE